MIENELRVNKLFHIRFSLLGDLFSSARALSSVTFKLGKLVLRFPEAGYDSSHGGGAIL